MTDTNITAGSINEGGLIRDIDKRGFSHNNCLSELIANSLEEKVNATKVVIRVTRDYIYVIDDGEGMNRKDCISMLEIFGSNNSNNKSMGVSGLGLKAATKILSNNTNVTIFTYNKGTWLKINLPWHTIVSENKYTGAATINDLEQEDKDELLKFDINDGTIIKIIYTKELYNAIKNNFGDSRKRLPIKERLDFIFGLKPQEIQLIDDIELDNTTTINQGYDYFGAESKDFYKRKYEDRIVLYDDGNGNIHIIYVNEDEDETKYFETRKKKKKDNELTEVTKVKKNYIVKRKWQPVGEINVVNGMRKDKNIVNEQSSKDFEGNEPTEYDLQFFEYDNRIDIVKKEVAEIMMYRNNQFIGKLPLDKYKSSSARSNYQFHNKIINFRTAISYETLSTQDNEIDKVLCIQSNKNQLNSDEISQEIKDILTHIKDMRWNSINNYFKTIFDKNKNKEPNEPKPKKKITKFSLSEPSACNNGTNTETDSPNTPPTEPEPLEAKQPTLNTPPTEPDPLEAKQPTLNTPPTKIEPQKNPEAEQPDRNACTEQLEPELPGVSLSNQTGKDFRQIVEQKIYTKIDNNKSYKKQDIENFINEVENLYDRFFNQM